MKTCLVGCVGTGGHIYPDMSLAANLKAKKSELKLFYTSLYSLQLPAQHA